MKDVEFRNASLERGREEALAQPRLDVLVRPSREILLETLRLQDEIVERKVAHRNQHLAGEVAPEDGPADVLLLCEPEHIYTTGRGSEHLPPSVGKYAEVPWLELNRGGQATYHGPGQLVCFPVFNLENHGADVHIFLRKLEDVLILTLRSFDISAYTRTGLTGVWVATTRGEKKIASIGIGVRKWVSYHGIALNISPDLGYFRAISPCGQDGSVVTSLNEVLTDAGRELPSLTLVEQTLISSFRELFSFSREEEKYIRVGRPDWLKAKAPGSAEYLQTRSIVKDLNLVTVCEEARCPNIGECWSHHTATFMIMGELCTRRCSFCSIKDGSLTNLKPLDQLEPYRVGKAVSELGLKHVVVTSVNRDDIDDMGAEHFDLTVRQIRKHAPQCRVELLIPDMMGRRERIETILKSGEVSVLNHNVETVPRLYREVRPGASFKRSLSILQWAKELSPKVLTKSGIMVGLGEEFDEVLEVLDALREHSVDILTIGQYLRPSAKQLPVKRFVTPEEFERFRLAGVERGFTHVESGPLVRSSYHAWKHSAKKIDDEALVATA